MNILDKITKAKREEVALLKKDKSISFFRDLPGFERERASFHDSLQREGIALITEFKRRSPSKGDIRPDADLESVVRSYTAAGARAISVLTDPHFDGHGRDLEMAALHTHLPLLRKDFIIDGIQVYQARALGASAVLLIAAILGKGEAEDLFGLASELGMDVLFEIHEAEELRKMPGGLKIVGINNRNLKTFRVDIHHSLRLRSELPDHLLAVAESGLGDHRVIREMHEEGFKAFLIGEGFMRVDDPGEGVRSLLNELG